jgi:hypothetical protein
MSYLDLVNSCKFVPASAPGTADFVFSAAVTGHQSPSAAGALDGNSYRYRAESDDLTIWEIGTAVYTASSGTFARTPLVSSAGASTKANFTVIPKIGITFFAADVRRRLTGSISISVSLTGNDTTGNGSSAAPFRTKQAAYDFLVANFDTAGFTAFINVAAGTTYTDSFVASKPWIGGGSVIMVGDQTTPANVTNTTSGQHFSVSCVLPSVLIVAGFKLVGGQGIIHNGGGLFEVSDIDFGAMIICMNAGSGNGGGGANLLVVGGLKVSGNISVYFATSQRGAAIMCENRTITFTGTPVIGTFVNVESSGVQYWGGCTFSGATSGGTKFRANTNGNISTDAGSGPSGISYLPGATAGTFGGGYYDTFSGQPSSNSASGVALNNDTATNITSVTLGPGTWMVWGVIVSGLTVLRRQAAGISTTSGALGAFGTYASQDIPAGTFAPAADITATIATPPVILQLTASSTTVFLVGYQVNGSSSADTVNGIIQAKLI